MKNQLLDKALEFTLAAEGGFAHVKGDRGGPTNYGVTQATFDTYRRIHRLPPIPVKGLNLETAKRIYHDLFWLPLRPDYMADNLAVAAFDYAVHSGVTSVVRRLQRLLKVKDDGIIGPITKAALQQAGDSLTRPLLVQRLGFLRGLAREASQKKFLKGWENRVFNLANFLGVALAHE